MLNPFDSPGDGSPQSPSPEEGGAGGALDPPMLNPFDSPGDGTLQSPSAEEGGAGGALMDPPMLNPFDSPGDGSSSSPEEDAGASALDPPMDSGVTDTLVEGAYEPPLPPHQADDPIMMFRSPTPVGQAKSPGMFQEWEAANQRYEEQQAAEADEEVLGDDPLALSPGSMSVGDSFGGWSLGPGMIERKSLAHPYDVDDESDDDGDSKASDRSSSPRTGCCKRLGLSMVKEDDEEEANRGTTMFDDVDLEANPNELPTAGDMVGSPNVSRDRKKSGSNSGSNGGGLGDRWKEVNEKGSSLANRALHEFQSNPSFKFRSVVALTAVVVFSCLLAVVVASASNKNEQPLEQEGIAVQDMGSILDLMESRTTGALGTTESPSASPTTPKQTSTPTYSPSFLTYDPTSYPTHTPTTRSPSGSPTSGATTKMPSYSPTNHPSKSPVTPSPTRDCSDDFGEFLTYNDKLRGCDWLDNGYNGAKSDRKDLNCPDAQIGDACRYTCRLYNGCMDYLLDSTPEFTAENDASIGNPCMDKPGSFVSNGGVERECGWIEEDPDTAPVKKNLNCGTPNAEGSELGVMCPASCAGYNHCARMSNGSIQLVGLPPEINAESRAGVGGNSDVQLVAPADAGGNDGSDGDDNAPTPFPTTWSSVEPTALCLDREGSFLTHMGTLRQCRWLNRDDNDTSEEKKLLNCGITEIGQNCFESCPCEPVLVQRTDDASGTNATVTTSGTISTIVSSSTTVAPTTPNDPVAIDENNETLTLGAYADALVSEKDPDENQGDSNRLNVEFMNGAGSQRHSLILFDLSYVEHFLDTVSAATLSLYSVTGSDAGGVMLKKMASPSFDESTVTWNNMPGGDGAGEPIVAYVDSLEANTWYDVDVTAAVLDAIDNDEPSIGIRIVSEDDVGANPNPLYFASRERDNLAPTLVLDSKTAEPTMQPVMMPTYYPTSWMPTAFPTPVPLTCMDRDGKFKTQAGDREPCSWLESGDGNLDNCEDEEVAMFCQSSCSAYNGCDELHCEDLTGTYQSHTGWNAECGWLSTGNGPLKLEQNCGIDGSEPTELGMRCQLTCAAYNGCDAAREIR
ncbi:hypothetical protein ACHAXT_001073 [Thalassiosira profunda]